MAAQKQTHSRKKWKIHNIHDITIYSMIIGLHVVPACHGQTSCRDAIFLQIRIGEFRYAGGEVTVLSGHHNECPLPKAQALGFLYVWSVHVQCRPCQLCCESFLLSRRVPVRRQVGWCVESIRQRRSFDCSVHVYQRVHSASTWVVWMNVHSGYSSECSMVVPT